MRCIIGYASCAVYRPLVILGVAFLLAGSNGCKTQEDATAAAVQMSSTSRILSAYYTSLDHVISETQDAYQAQSALSGVPAQDLSETRAQIRLRADMVAEIGDIAALFEKINRSSAASDASAAGGKLNAELVSVKAIASNDTETKAVTTGIQAIVTLIQQHEEVKAAARLSPLCHDLSVFFDSERDAYDSLNKAYLVTARSVSEQLVKSNQVNTDFVYVSALQPFGLFPAIDQKQTKVDMQPYLMTQIQTGYTINLELSQKASAALSAALKEMDARVELVMHDKPMRIRTIPFSLETATKWISASSK